ncbi:MAG: RHS repeat protein, partial [Caldilineaceae bacterium]|nr:RHS repeat protein [Caldilineaceae bacterium]
MANDGGFLGYKSVRTTFYDIDRSTVLRYEAMVGMESGATADRANPDPRRGHLKRHEVWSSQNGILLSEADYDWKAYWWLAEGGWQTTATVKSWRYNSTTHRNEYPPTWVRLEKETRKTYGDQNASTSNETRLFYQKERQGGSHAGNATEIQEWADGSHQRTTFRDFYPNWTRWILAQPAREQVYDKRGGANTCASEMRTLYGAANIDKGYQTPPEHTLPSKLETALTACSSSATIGKYDANWEIVRMAYDAYGNRTTVNQLGAASDGSQDFAISTGYDGIYHLFPVEQFYQVQSSHREKVKYYGVNGSSATSTRGFFGAIEEHCGVNEVCTRQSYDQFGRRILRWEGTATSDAWGSDASAQVRWAYDAYGAYNGALKMNKVTEWRAPRCEGNFTRRMYDGLGQLVRVSGPDENWRIENNYENCGPGGGNFPEIDIDYQYDGLGRVMRESVPHATTLDWKTRPADWSKGYTQHKYDGLGREIERIAPNGERTKIGYYKREVWTIGLDSAGNLEKLLEWTDRDGLGNLAKVRTYDRSGSSWSQTAEVALSHDGMGRLTKVTHAGGLGTTTLAYDLAGRKKSLSDPDLGVWNYSYDRRGKLTRQVDARGNATCFYYDAIERVSREYFTTGSCPGSAPG